MRPEPSSIVFYTLCIPFLAHTRESAREYKARKYSEYFSNNQLIASILISWQSSASVGCRHRAFPGDLLPMLVRIILSPAARIFLRYSPGSSSQHHTRIFFLSSALRKTLRPSFRPFGPDSLLGRSSSGLPSATLRLPCSNSSGLSPPFKLSAPPYRAPPIPGNAPPAAFAVASTLSQKTNHASPSCCQHVFVPIPEKDPPERGPELSEPAPVSAAKQKQTRYRRRSPQEKTATPTSGAHHPIFSSRP